VKPSCRPRVARVVALGAAVVLTAAACESNPSPHRVAEDLIETLADTDAERDCMLDILDGYANDDLEAWGEAVENGQPGTASYDDAQAELDAFQAELETCRE
jgi:hypothetical protein